MTPLRIGLNLLYLIPSVVGGTETYAAGLLGGLARVDSQTEFVVFVNQEAAQWRLPAAPNVQRVVCPVSAHSRSARYAFEQLRFPSWLRRYHVDLVHSLGYISPLWPPCPAVVTVPDVNFLAFGAQMSLPRRLALTFFTQQSARRAKHVITISEFAATEVMAACHLPRARLTVTHLAPRADLPLADQTPPLNQERASADTPPYILAFSSTYPNKNIPRLLEAFRLARDRHHLPHRLVLVGHLPETPLALDDPAIHAAGYVSEARLAELLTGAELLVFPSVYEGFGLPVLEAMAAGVPVVCSNRAALPEVAGTAAEFFNPLSVTDMAGQIAKVALDPALRSAMRTKGYENLKRFSWEQTAQATLAVYRAVLAQTNAQRVA